MVYVSCNVHCYFDTSKTVVLGVIGADVMFAPFFDFLRKNFDPCTITTNEYSIHFTWCL